MAVGDVINGIGSTNAILDYQPASGVEAVITWISDNTNGHFLYNGTNGCNPVVCILAGSFITTDIKLFVNNTRYLRLALNANEAKGYSGVQTK